MCSYVCLNGITLILRRSLMHESLNHMMYTCSVCFCLSFNFVLYYFLVTGVSKLLQLLNKASCKFVVDLCMKHAFNNEEVGALVDRVPTQELQEEGRGGNQGHSVGRFTPKNNQTFTGDNHGTSSQTNKNDNEVTQNGSADNSKEKVTNKDDPEVPENGSADNSRGEYYFLIR